MKCRATKKNGNGTRHSCCLEAGHSGPHKCVKQVGLGPRGGAKCNHKWTTKLYPYQQALIGAVKDNIAISLNRRRRKGRLNLVELFDAIYLLKRARNNRHAWHAALKEAAEVREFPNLMFAHKWITSLAKTGIYPSCYFTRPGD